MTGRLVDMAFTLGGKQRVTLEINGDFREIWDKLHQEPVLDVEIKKHREKRSLSANAYFHVLCNKISAETGESEDAVKRRLVVSYGALARDKDGKPVGLKLPPTVDPSDFYPYVRLYETRQENGKDYSCYRAKSKRLGLWVTLCPWCHQNGSTAIHNNRDADLRLKRWAQKKAMEHYGWPEARFIQEFGRSYL